MSQKCGFCFVTLSVRFRLCLGVLLLCVACGCHCVGCECVLVVRAVLRRSFPVLDVTGQRNLRPLIASANVHSSSTLPTAAAASTSSSASSSSSVSSTSRWQHGWLQGSRKVRREQALLGGALLHAHQPALLLRQQERNRTQKKIHISRQYISSKLVSDISHLIYLILGIVVLDDANRVAHLEAQLVHVLLQIFVCGLDTVQNTRRQIGCRRIC